MEIYFRGYNTGAQLRRFEGGESEDDDSVRGYGSRRGGQDYAMPTMFSGSRHLRSVPDSFASCPHQSTMEFDRTESETVVLTTSCPLPDVFRDPFSAPSLGRLLSMMDDFAAVAPGRGGAVRRGWNAKEDEEALHLRVDMPGLGKEHVKVWAEQNSLLIKGEGEKEDGEDETGLPPRYSGRIELTPDVYRMDKIKAEMKNGVLKVVVPKVKEEKRKDVFQVNIE
ncbi:hypothetical protein U9M48_021863 [Paspalum notatum var. saurae]|uniref:SHSP domain-containing protein n=1 Tax=Paspalum notatum var. saurae TaxID=547442 RepID=A0AAQ3THK3_PASNO